jgi:hypothetical protein
MHGSGGHSEVDVGQVADTDGLTYITIAPESPEDLRWDVPIAPWLVFNALASTNAARWS